ncbi:MAG: tight adherence protein [Frankiales bacterium]|jgi:tight adherence protein B|nr:tight adherence protein [Frankiales bacterium]
MNLTVAYLALSAAVFCVCASAWMFLQDRARLVEFGRALTAKDGGRQQGARAAWERRFLHTRAGIALKIGLEELGLPTLQAVDGLIGLCLAAALLALLVGKLLSWLLAPVAVICVVPAVLSLINRRRNRRKERFIAQMPQLARVLSNATNAGLSIRTAIEIAAEEMPEPAASEMARVSDSLAVGETLDGALAALEQRLPAREVAVLVSTLVVSSRAGGSLISSLRAIAETLDERRQTRREVLTLLSEAKATATLIPIIGIGSLIMLNNLRKNALSLMLSRPVGQLIFFIAVVMYAVGFVLFRRVTKVEM